MVVVNDNYINDNFIFNNGKESLAIISLLSRNITLRNRLTTGGEKSHQVVFNMKYLFDNLNVKLTMTKPKNNIISSLQNLVENNVFIGQTNFEKININTLIYLEYQIIKKGFTVIKDYEFDIIFNYNQKRIDKYGLFNTYLAIKKYCDNDTKISYPSIEKIMGICCISSNNTILKYIDVLIELKLISCDRGTMYTNVYGERRKSNNVYKVLV